MNLKIYLMKISRAVATRRSLVGRSDTAVQSGIGASEGPDMTLTSSTVQGMDPRTGLPSGEPVAVTSAEELDRVLSDATSAFARLCRGTPELRSGLLRALADRLDDEVAGLVELAASETGLPIPRLHAEVARTSGQLRLFADVVEEGSCLEVILDAADPTATPPQPDLRRWLEPMGPVLVFTASNFPFAFSILGGDTASALASGCPVVVKAHSSHPGLSRAVAQLAHEVIAQLDLPRGALSVVYGTEVGAAALRDPRIKAAGFTGSTTGGRVLFDIAAGRPEPIPFYGELGSVNPTVVTPAAVAARGAEICSGFVGSMTIGTGQFCTKPGLLFLPEGHGLDGSLRSAVEGVDPAPMLNARIKEQLANGLSELASRDDVAPVAQSADPPAEGSWASAALFSTTAKAVRNNPDELMREHFGPAGLIVEYRSYEDLFSVLQVVPGSLTATVHAELEDDFDIVSLLDLLARRAGRVIFNGWPTGVAVTWSMNHGGPWPATTSVAHTSVGATSIRRWLRPVCYQSVPEELLPEPLRSTSTLSIPRRVNGRLTW
jgi:NADP-dependent aldehyde dehydrogenase